MSKLLYSKRKIYQVNESQSSEGEFYEMSECTNENEFKEVYDSESECAFKK
jgi:hypothetical protein